MTLGTELAHDDDVIRDLLAPFARVQPVTLRHRPSGRPLRRVRPLVMVAVGVTVLAGVGAGTAVGTGVLPWWQHHEVVMQLPFFTSTDPAALPGSIVHISVPGPEGLTFEFVTNDAEMVGTVRQHCSGLFAHDAQGRPVGGFPVECGPASAYRPQAASGATTYMLFQGAPSGATYAVFTGTTPVSAAATVALVDGAGGAVASGTVADGYYLAYAPVDRAADSLVFYDAGGQVVKKLAITAP